MTPKIAAVATSVPSHRFDQSTLLRLAGYGDARRTGFFANSQVEGRHLYVDPDAFAPNESIDQLNARFRRGAVELGTVAVLRALERAGWTRDDVDFLATTSCTGRMCPSLDAHLIKELGFKSSIQRVHVGDTGCASAMVALQQTCNHLHAFPGHRAVIVAVEICSAAYFPDDRLESAVAHAIFADGAAAIALDTTGDGPAIVLHRTIFRSEHLAAMGFEYPGGRPRVVLAQDVRRIGAEMIKDMADTLLAAQGLKQPDIGCYILHSAGRRVIDRAAGLMDLDDDQLAHSRRVLRHYGNMSSATVLFVLDEVIRAREPAPGDWGLMIALGPGFAAEGALLKW
jgi:alkylresorcinol/alkylpyrone synthase